MNRSPSTVCCDVIVEGNVFAIAAVWTCGSPAVIEVIDRRYNLEARIVVDVTIPMITTARTAKAAL
jgi:hypothetical protein